MSATPCRPLLRTRSVRRGLAVALLAGAATSAGAQEVGRLEGTVIDSLSAVAPIAGAQVSATRVGAHRETTFVALTDDKGRSAFDRLDAGEYALGFAHALLDSLEFGGPAQRVTVPGAGVARAALAVPSAGRCGRSPVRG